MSWSTEAQLFADVRNVFKERTTWRSTRALVRPFSGRLAALVAVCLVGAAMTLVQPLLFRAAIDAVVADATDRPWHGLSLGTVCLLLLLTGAVSVAATFEQARRQAVLNEELAQHLRTRLFDHVQRQPYGFFVHANPGAVFNRLWDEVQRASFAVPFVVAEVATGLLILLMGPVLVVVYDWHLAVILAFLVAVLLPARWIRSKIRNHLVAQVANQSRYTGYLQERASVSGALLTKTFGRYDANLAELQGYSDEQRRRGSAAFTWGAANQALITSGLAVASAGTLWIGGNAVVSGSMSLGALALLLFYLRILAGPVQRYGDLRFELIRGTVAFGRITEILDLPTDDRGGAGPVEDAGADLGAGALELDGVSFRFPTPKELVPDSLASLHLAGRESEGDAWVLDDVSLRVEAGQFVALVGSSGSGKSTIAALAAGLLAPTQGHVRIGGRDVRALAEADLARLIGLVTQDTHLLHDTVRNNLLLANPGATDKQVVRACGAAGIHRFIRSLPNGYGTVVGERGARLSGGQRQRLAFARVVLRDPAVVILDEATAHLDAESEVLLREAVDQVLAGRTRLVIAHRLSTVVGADRIVVLEGGRVVEQGTHDELLARQGRYAALYDAQMVTDNGSNGPNGQEGRDGPVGADREVPGARAGGDHSRAG
jgi:ATP-binding cassette subfamily B protein